MTNMFKTNDIDVEVQSPNGFSRQFSNSWKYDKFVKEMWDIGKETNKVVLGFLKQLLGVNKKTTNIAIHAETGKHPISLKIFNHIIKYWLRLNTSQKDLLKMAKDLYESVKHTEMFLLRNHNLQPFPKTAYCTFFNIRQNGIVSCS